MKISVLTPSFNSEDFLERAIESVINQDYTNWEHIVMDGGSLDGTVAILKKHTHIIWKSEKDKGQSDAMNKAFEICTGDIIVYLNADDYFEPNIFSLIIESFKSNDCDMVVGNGRFIVNGIAGEQWNAETNYLKCLIHFKYTFPLNSATYFYKRKVQDQVGGFNIHNHYTMDYEFLLQTIKRFKTKKIEVCLGNFWMDGLNKTSTVNAFLECRATAISFCRKYDFLGLLYYRAHQYQSNFLFWTNKLLTKVELNKHKRSH